MRFLQKLYVGGKHGKSFSRKKCFSKLDALPVIVRLVSRVREIGHMNCTAFSTNWNKSFAGKEARYQCRGWNQ
jgi:hypothetical protein